MSAMRSTALWRALHAHSITATSTKTKNRRMKRRFPVVPGCPLALPRGERLVVPAVQVALVRRTRARAEVDHMSGLIRAEQNVLLKCRSDVHVVERVPRREVRRCEVVVA